MQTLVFGGRNAQAKRETTMPLSSPRDSSLFFSVFPHMNDPNFTQKNNECKAFLFIVAVCDHCSLASLGDLRRRRHIVKNASISPGLR